MVVVGGRPEMCRAPHPHLPSSQRLSTAGELSSAPATGSRPVTLDRAGTPAQGRGSELLTQSCPVSRPRRHTQLHGLGKFMTLAAWDCWYRQFKFQYGWKLENFGRLKSRAVRRGIGRVLRSITPDELMVLANITIDVNRLRQRPTHHMLTCNRRGKTENVLINI